MNIAQSSNGSAPPDTQAFPIVGIGASAGGLQALISFFEHTPSDAGMAFVVVLHLAPTHASNAGAILQRATGMPVVEVVKATRIEVNTVYVISPNKQMEMIDGYLRVKERPAANGRPVAIDVFFRTLGKVHGERAFGIVLSGTGSDGAYGLSMIKHEGGVVFAQQPEDAEHAGMPQAAIDTGIVDFVLPVAAMPERLIAIWRNAQKIRLPGAHEADAPQAAPAAPDSKAELEEALREIFAILRLRTGHDVTKYKRATLLRRLERRLQVREKVDLISCRNLLIYLNRDAHAQVLEMFHFALRGDGYLFLGSSESADAVADFFVPIDKKSRIYRAKPSPRFARSLIALGVTPSVAPAAADPDRSDKSPTSFASVHQRVLAEYAPPSVLIDHQSNIVHLSEGTSQFLRHVAGEPSRNLVALVEPELRPELRTALFHAIQSGTSVETRRIQLERAGRVFYVNMTARPFYDAATATDFVLVLFHKVEQTTERQVVNSDGAPQDAVLSGLEEELKRTRTQLQETIEHSETSTEELKASNEELQAINEELRSATEELETSKEELQSVNEELTTVNFELKSKVEEASKVHDDLQNLIASTDLATIFVDRGMRIKRYTPHACDLFNLIPSDIGRPLDDITHKLRYAELASDAGAAFATLKCVEREVSSEDGRWFIARLLPYRTVQDRIDGAVLTFIDITSRRQAEERARAGEERMRLVADCAKDYAIITMDREGLITSFNSGAERLFGYTEQEVLGQPDELIYTPEDRQAGVPAQEKRRAREEGRAEDERWHQRKNGSRFFCSGVVTPLSDGEFYGYVKIGRDLTARLEQEKYQAERLAQEQSRRMQAQLDNAQKDEFLAIMAHELKHPLNLIHMNAELLSRVPALEAAPHAQKAVGAIRSAAMGQAKIINDLLDLSRIKTGKMALNPVPLDLCAMVRTLAAIVADAPQVARLSVECCIDGEAALMVSADQVRMEQVVWNLLNNAVKFTPRDGEVRVSVGADGHCARLEVRDSGQGIAPEFLGKIFDLFGQGSASIMRGAKGLGIGLALVRQIVELHGGRVEAASDGIGKGATFTVWLPLAGAPAPDRPAPADTGAASLAGVRMLVLDDSSEALEAFHILLEMEGAEVTSTTSAVAALAMLEQQEFDLIVSDLAMPEMDGYTFIREIRKRPAVAKLPALAITGLGRPKDIEEAMAAGFSGHIGKPVDIAALARLARQLLGQH